MKLLLASVFLLSIVVSSLTRAEAVNTTAQTSGVGTITQFYANRGANFLRVKFSKDMVNPAGCEGEGFYIAELEGSDNGDRFYSTVLAAFMANKNVSFWVSGCTERRYWEKSRPRIVDIYVSNN